MDSDDLKSMLSDVFSPTFPRRSFQAPVVSVYGDEPMFRAGLRLDVRSHLFRSP